MDALLQVGVEEDPAGPRAAKGQLPVVELHPVDGILVVEDAPGQVECLGALVGSQGLGGGEAGRYQLHGEVVLDRGIARGGGLHRDCGGQAGAVGQQQDLQVHLIGLAGIHVGHLGQQGDVPAIGLGGGQARQ